MAYGISMWRVKQGSITTAAVLKLTGLRELDVYVARRRIRWLGHVAGMEWSRVPRKLLSSWVYQARPTGRPCMRWAGSIEYDMNLAGVKLGTWQDVAMDREKLKQVIKNIKTKKKRNKRKNTKL